MAQPARQQNQLRVSASATRMSGFKVWGADITIITIIAIFIITITITNY